jgi:hypothetical protein
VRGELATSGESFYHFIQNGTLTHTINATKDVYLTVQVPNDVFLPAPERVDLNPFDIVCVLRHSFWFLFFAKINKKAESSKLSAVYLSLMRLYY